MVYGMVENVNNDGKIQIGDKVVVVQINKYRLWGKLLSVDALFLTLRFDDGRTRQIPMISILSIEPDKKRMGI
jgi:hypothetical protein